MGLWLWLEYTNYPNIISTMMQLSDSLVKSLSNEALTCLDTLAAFENPPIPKDGEDLDLLDAKIWSNKRPCDDVTEEDKTMFLTFSRGFPVSEEEVRELFITDYGNGSVVEIVMGNYEANNQSMFATMVLNGVALVDEILQGLRLAKLRANGKDIWVRKYDRRN
ncbi:uncharacterized protein [Arachis hypogaea]|uniref:uncharacterized protein n=1 Tax=Arachis hypogaea TaxID=3818 RepID=UPI000DECB7C4|nr:uncharacterized protein LOC112742193 [Arachis hypogaea]